jgi:hypothetical protein
VANNRRKKRHSKAVRPSIAAAASRSGQLVNTPLGPAAGVQQLTPAALNALTNAPAGMEFAPLPRDPRDDNPFGPLPPLVPQALDQARRDTGRPEPRLSEYDPAWNIPGSGRRRVPWRVLREASTDVDLLRLCIQIRKSHVSGLDWAWTLSDTAVEQAMLTGKHASRLDAEGALREQMQPEIARLTAFWERPWRSNNLTFKQWVDLILEEVLVLDALAVYPRMTLGGQLLDLEVLDGSTVKPLRDWRGALPTPPMPAYQQELYGFPRGEFTATVVDTPDGQVVPGAFLADQLYYFRSVPLTHTPYGMSAVERALISARLYLMRQGWMLAEYDDGASPNTWLTADSMVANLGNEPFTAQKRGEYQRALNDELRGNTRERQRIQIAPPGFDLKWPQSIDSKYKPDYDQHLITLMAAHLDITMAELGFMQSGGLGSSGFHEGQEDVQNRKATLPTCRMLSEIIVELSRSYLGAPKELTFKFLGLEQEDEAAQDTVAQGRVASGRMTLNEDRDRQGKPRYAFPEADMPQLQTQRGIVFIEGASEAAPPGELVMPAQAPPDDSPDGGPQAPAGGDEAEDGTQQGAKPTKKPPASVGKATPVQAAEIASFRRYLTKAGAAPSRPFLFKTMTIREALGCGALDPDDIGTKATFESLLPKA